MEKELKYPLCAVTHPGGVTRGGNQNLSERKNISQFGCGIVGAAELIIYLCRHGGCSCHELIGDIPLYDRVSLDDYNRLLRRLSSRYLPIIPKSGINGLELALGVNLIFRKYNFPYRAYWGIGEKNLYEDIGDMLDRDTPVIISVGPNFPKVWEKHRIDLYSMRQDGELEKAASVNSHYMIVTGLDSDKIRVSSWGREFYIKRYEFDSYIKNHSSSIVCNILHII